MRNSSENSPNSSGPIEQQLADIRSDVLAHGMSSRELFEAYQIAMGLEAGSTPPRPEVSRLAQKLDGYMRAGLPANKIAELVSSKEQLESIPAKFDEMVNQMPITPNEKHVLRSIIEHRRPGKLEVFDRQSNRRLGGVIVPVGIKDGNYPKEMIIQKLLAFLLRFQTSEIAIQFEAD